MAKISREPRCIYDQSAMVPASDPAGNPGVFIATVMANKIVQLGQGFTFRIYECPKCTYLEFHDYEPDVQK